MEKFNKVFDRISWASEWPQIHQLAHISERQNIGAPVLSNRYFHKRGSNFVFEIKYQKV